MFKPYLLTLVSLSLLWQTAVAGEPYVIQQSPVGTTVILGGTVVPYKEITLAAQLPGRVEMIAGEEGSPFSKDTVLIALDDSELLAKRRAAFAEMMNADAVLRNASVQYSRELYSPNSPDGMKTPGGMALPNLFDQFFSKPASDILGQSDHKLDRQAELFTYGTQIEQARNALLRAQSQIEQIDAKLRDARGKAPFDGVITRKKVEVGDTVQPGQPLLEFADIQYLQIRVEVPARLVQGLKVGMFVWAKLDAINARVKVRVAQIFPIADPQRHTITTKFDLPLGTHTNPGQYAQVELFDTTAQIQSTPVIPRAALVWRGSLPGVYVLHGNGGEQRRELRLIRLGNAIDQHMVSVLSGVKVGETIELNPAPGTTSGMVQPHHGNASHH